MASAGGAAGPRTSAGVSGQEGGDGGHAASGGAAGASGIIGTGGNPGSGGATANTGGLAGGSTQAPWLTLPARSVGCGKAAKGTGSYVRQDMQVAAKARANFLWLPLNYDPTKAHELLISLHGTGGVAPGDGKGIETAAGNEAIIMTPQGIDGMWQLGADGEDVAFFDAMYAFATENFCVNQQRVFVTGFSRGAAMSNLLGCVRGDKIRGIGPLAGWQPARQTDCRGRPAAWFAHGTSDGAVPIVQGTRSLGLQMVRNGCEAATAPTPPSPCVAQQGCDTGSPVVWCEIPGDHGTPIEWSVPALWKFFAAL